MERVGNGRYEIVGEASSGRECMALVDALRPDLVLLDLTMPQTDPYEIIGDVKTRFPGTNVIVLSGFDHDIVEGAVIASGADGYVEKGGNIAQLSRQIDDLLAIA
jgi:DNA-binding NarL/FixJ family response regulator